jgi:hypothetical protein
MDFPISYIFEVKSAAVSSASVSPKLFSENLFICAAVSSAVFLSTSMATLVFIFKLPN